MARRTAFATRDAKRSTEQLTAMEEGDEVSISTADGYYRGEISEVRDERPPAANVVVDTFDDHDEVIVTSEFEGPDDAAHIDTGPEDFTVTATVDGGVESESVESVVNWDHGLEAPDETISEADGEDIEAEMEEAIENADEAIYELLHMKVILRQALRGEITFAEMEEAMIELEAEQGGTLSVDDHW